MVHFPTSFCLSSLLPKSLTLFLSSTPLCTHFSRVSAALWLNLIWANLVLLPAPLLCLRLRFFPPHQFASFVCREKCVKLYSNLNFSAVCYTILVSLPLLWKCACLPAGTTAASYWACHHSNICNGEKDSWGKLDNCCYKQLGWPRYALLSYGTERQYWCYLIWIQWIYIAIIF